MKQYQLSVFVLFVCLSGTLFFPLRSYGQLTGNYTINPTKAASNSNYRDWASAISDLTSGTRSDGGTAQGSGVSGAVIFTVYDTVYANTSITLTSISGTSLTNTITFKSTSGDSTKCVLQYASGTAATDDWVLNLNGADFITFTRMGFERTGLNTYGTVVQITNDADNNRFIRCQMKGQKLPSSITKGFQTGIGSCVFFSGNGDSTRLTQNRFLYGYNGVYNLIACAGNNFSQNVCDTPGSAGIYVNSQSLFKVIGNTFNMGDFGAGKGHYTCYALRLDASSGFTVANNKAIVTAVNSQVCRSFVFSSNTSTAAAPAMVYNNSIYNSGGTGNCNGMAINGCAYLNIYYNNILVNNSLTDGAALFQYITTTNSKINLLNNNFINKGGGYALSAGDANASGFDSLDYNNLYSTGSYVALWNSSSGKYSSLSSYQSASGKCANCLSLDPGYVSNSDLHVSNIAINGKALPTPRVLYDIDYETRNSTKPDIGSDEFFPVTTDAGLASIDSPSLFCAGKQIVKVRFQNFGSDTLKSVKIGWTVNGVSQTGISWTGSVNPGASSASLSLGNYTFAGNTAYNFKIWTYNPNGAPDGKPLNDTLKQTKYAAMAGTYTIGDTNIANYKTFNNAITAMAERGICGAVTFNVYNGTYKEQLGLTQLPGMGSSSPVTFQSLSKDSSKVVISLIAAANSGSNNAAVQLRGANYVTFKGITFLRSGTNLYAQVVHIMNGSHHNTFSNCQMIGLQLTAININANNIWSDQSQDNFNTFRNNYVKWGNFSMAYAGTSASSHETGTVIENNTFEGAYNNSVQLLYNDKAIVRGNIFKDVTASATGNYDLMMMHCDSNIYAGGNYFKSINTATSLIAQACFSTITNPSFIASNSIVRDNGIGVLLDTTGNTNVVFNSINFTGSTATSAGIRTNGNSYNAVIKNNNIVMSVGEVFHITLNTDVRASDYNNLYAKGLQFAYWGGTSYTSLSSLVAAGGGRDTHSLAVDPMFKSSSDLHIINPALKGAGKPIAGITTDIDGDVRNLTTPDIGADEFKLYPSDAGAVAVTQPLSNTCVGILPVQVVIKNFGGDTLKNATINWSVNGVTQTPYSWTGKLATNRRDTVILGNFNFLSVQTPKFIIKTSQPNNQSDGILYNDSIIVTRALLPLPFANAGSDDTICSGDQLLVGSASNPAYNYKWRTNLSNVVIDTLAQITVKPLVSTSYALEVINKISGCSKRDTVSIHVDTLPLAHAGPDSKICLGSSAQLGAAAQTGFTYKWNSLPSGFSSTASNPTATPGVTTTYALVITSTKTGCKGTDSATVTVVMPPVAQISGTNSLCLGSQASYTTANHSGNTYVWSITGGQILSGQNSNTINVLWNASGTGSLSVLETNASFCKDTAMYNVTVAVPPVSQISGTLSLCLNGQADYTTASHSGSSYLWSITRGQIVSGQNSNTIKVLWNASGTDSLKVIETNASLCRDTAVYAVAVNGNPTADFSVSSVCKGNNTSYTDLSTGALTHHWDFGDGDTSVAASPAHIYANAGSHAVTLIVKNNAGCYDTAVKTTLVYPIPVAGFSVTKIGGEKNYSFTDASTIAAGTIISWKWQFGDGDSALIQSPTHQYTTAGNYNVTLCVTSDHGCKHCTTQTQNVLGFFNPAFDNMLTAAPNPGSGIFRITSLKPVDVVTVTNMLGQVVATFNPSDNTFSLDLSDQPDGVYMIKVASGANSSGLLKLVKQQ